MKKKKILFYLFVSIITSIITVTTTTFAASVVASGDVSINTISGIDASDVSAALGSLNTTVTNLENSLTTLETKYTTTLASQSSGSQTVVLYCYGNVCMVKINAWNPGNITARTTIATVPAGYRPGLVTLAASAGIYACGGVESNGQVWLDPCAKNQGNWLSFTYPKWQ